MNCEAEGFLTRLFFGETRMQSCLLIGRAGQLLAPSASINLLKNTLLKEENENPMTAESKPLSEVPIREWPDGRMAKLTRELLEEP